jgi:hypothetical protein
MSGTIALGITIVIELRLAGSMGIYHAGGKRRRDSRQKE